MVTVILLIGKANSGKKKGIINKDCILRPIEGLEDKGHNICPIYLKISKNFEQKRIWRTSRRVKETNFTFLHMISFSCSINIDKKTASIARIGSTVQPEEVKFLNVFPSQFILMSF